MSKVVKDMVIDAIAERMDGVRELLVVDASRLDAVADNRWRLDLQKKRIQSLSVRNSLARRALKRQGIDGLDEALKGPSTLVYGGEDIVALSKEIVEAAKQNDKIQVKGGAAEGNPLDLTAIEALSKSPGRDELISMIAGQILAPGANLAAALLGPGAALASQVKTIADGEGAGEAEAGAASA